MPAEGTTGGAAGSGGADVKLYVDYMSQPSRCVVIFSRVNGLPVEVRPVLIHKGETRSPAYLALNPLGKVPLLEDTAAAASSSSGLGPAGGDGSGGGSCSSSGGSGGGCVLRLPESAAIMCYLADRFPGSVSEHWYPRADKVHRARVEAALHWYQGNIRAGAAKLSFHKVVAQRLGLPSDERVAADALKTLQLALAALQDVWLGGGARPFMTGPQPCAADLLAACELEQLRMLRAEQHGGLDFPSIMAPYPQVRAWQQRVREATEPHYTTAHRVLMAAVQRGGGGGDGGGGTGGGTGAAKSKL
ncbi:hypothetical protein HYH02_008961 [Chlamydomonas schloesseri]|uniref:Glutathione transferase n=1 Tax=Chlamydomonas schloesseri TaxID=2026947 RepID=A0A835WCU5_9CHLO|nr:hypothetical protein HYH02_008961 [Chlamydomonas schloesseri]|eukprot:KAG2445094.1 hypothetical protein HYH02_008961 [Chlamydomonas schloesseri]